MKRAVKSMETMNVTQWHAVRRLVSADETSVPNGLGCKNKKKKRRRNRMVDVVDFGSAISLDQLANYSSSGAAGSMRIFTPCADFVLQLAEYIRSS